MVYGQHAVQLLTTTVLILLTHVYFRFQGGYVDHQIAMHAVKWMTESIKVCWCIFIYQTNESRVTLLYRPLTLRLWERGRSSKCGGHRPGPKATHISSQDEQRDRPRLRGTCIQLPGIARWRARRPDAFTFKSVKRVDEIWRGRGGVWRCSKLSFLVFALFNC